MGKIIMATQRKHSAIFKVCRMCLAVDIKMYHKSQLKLDIMYSDVCGIKIAPNEPLPQMICWECAGRLRSAYKLKAKARTAHEFLSMLAQKSTIPTVEDTQFVNTFQHSLKSTLTKEYFNDHYDVIVQDDVIEELEEEFNFDDSNDVYLFDTPLLSNKQIIEPIQNLNIPKNDTASDSDVTHQVDSEKQIDNHKYKGIRVYSKNRKVDSDVIQSKEASFEIVDNISENFVRDNDELENKKFDVKVLDMENWMEILNEVSVPEKAAEVEILDGNIKPEEEVKDNNCHKKVLPKTQKNKKPLINIKNILQESEGDVVRVGIVRTDNKDVKVDDIENILTENNCSNGESLKKLKVLKLRKVTGAEKEALEAAQKVRGVIRVPGMLNEDIGGLDISNVRQTFAPGKCVKVVELKKVQGVEDIGVEKKIVGTIRQIRGVKKKIVKKLVRKRKPPVVKVPNRMGHPLTAPIDETLFTITPLTLEEQIACFQKRQESDSYITAPFKCNICFTGFNYKGTLESHSNRHSDVSGQFECIVCKGRYMTGKRLRHHMANLHKNQYTCNRCNFISYAESQARSHQKWHNGIKFTCPHCGRDFCKSTSYLSHLRLIHPSKYVCEYCGYAFVSKKGVYLHKKRKHATQNEIQLEGPPCEACNVEHFLNQHAYERHLLVSSVHTGGQSKIKNDYHGDLYSSMKRLRRKCKSEVSYKHVEFSCELCNEKIVGNYEYNKHLKQQHPGHNRTQFPEGGKMCEECGKVFMHLNSFNTHKISHTKPFRCKRCGNVFSTEIQLKQHRLMHTPVINSRVMCDYCQNWFCNKPGLVRHIKTVHLRLHQYPCPVCGKTLTTHANMKEHVVHVHQGVPRPRRIRIRRKPHFTLQEEVPVLLDIPVAYEEIVGTFDNADMAYEDYKFQVY